MSSHKITYGGSIVAVVVGRILWILILQTNVVFVVVLKMRNWNGIRKENPWYLKYLFYSSNFYKKKTYFSSKVSDVKTVKPLKYPVEIVEFSAFIKISH